MKNTPFSEITHLGDRTHGKITALYARNAQPSPEKIIQQRKELTAHAKDLAFANLCLYMDDGYSGMNDERPAYKQLMEDIRDNKIGVLIVRDISRLTRDCKQYPVLENLFDKHEVRLICITEKIDRLPPTLTDVKTGIRYDLHGDYYFPRLSVVDQGIHKPIGKWGMMYRDTLKENHPGLYSRLLLSGELYDRLHEVDTQANERFENMMEAYKQKWNITEALKAEDPMRWTGLMNNARNEVEWCIIREIIQN